MRIDQILQAVAVDLNDLAKAKSATVAIAEDLFHVIDILVNGPAGFQLIVSWGGDDAVGEQPGHPLAETIIDITVGFNPGLGIQPGNALVKNTATRDSLLKLINDVRARALTLQFPETETSQIPEYSGCRPVSLPDGIPLKAYKFSIKLTAAVDTDADYRITNPEVE